MPRLTRDEPTTRPVDPWSDAFAIISPLVISASRALIDAVSDETRGRIPGLESTSLVPPLSHRPGTRTLARLRSGRSRSVHVRMAQANRREASIA